MLQRADAAAIFRATRHTLCRYYDDYYAVTLMSLFILLYIR